MDREDALVGVEQECALAMGAPVEVGREDPLLGVGQVEGVQVEIGREDALVGKDQECALAMGAPVEVGREDALLGVGQVEGVQVGMVHLQGAMARARRDPDRLVVVAVRGADMTEQRGRWKKIAQPKKKHPIAITSCERPHDPKKFTPKISAVTGLLGAGLNQSRSDPLLSDIFKPRQSSLKPQPS